MKNDQNTPLHLGVVRKWFGSGSEVVRKWFGVVRKWYGSGSEVVRKWFGNSVFGVFGLFVCCCPKSGPKTISCEIFP
eukprot:6479437-Amphidinium_carterae.1